MSDVLDILTDCDGPTLKREIQELRSKVAALIKSIEVLAGRLNGIDSRLNSSSYLGSHAKPEVENPLCDQCGELVQYCECADQVEQKEPAIHD